MEGNITVLVVEDDRYINSFMTVLLKNEGYKALTAATGEEAVSLFYSNNPDIVLLDLGLPDMDGLEIINIFRERNNVPIIVVSAREEESEKIKALDNGADDYMVKPFSAGELLARIRVAQRKHGAAACCPEVYEQGGLTVDYAKGLVYLDGEEVHLTPLEYKLLKLLITNRGKVLTHSFIINHIWGYDESGDAKNLRVFMASLRHKIEKDPSNPKLILTQVGTGYRFVDKD